MHQVFDEIDKDGDGRVSCRDFVIMMELPTEKNQVAPLPLTISDQSLNRASFRDQFNIVTETRKERGGTRMLCSLLEDIP